MPLIDFSERDFFVGPEASRKYYKVNGINLHNGVVGYNSNTRNLVIYDEDDELSHKELVERRPDAIDVLSVPKLNSCHFILIKSKQNPHLFAIGHIAPRDDEQLMYEDLLMVNQNLHIFISFHLKMS